MTPLVSICCITYNHARFIRKCLDGFLIQETSFPIEILIHDDASTDGTDGIIREYADKYPDLILPLFETENQYSQGKQNKIDFYNYRRARGKYIAYCEGDDYWTDPLKLQKQVDFMESHPDYSVCFHRWKHFDEATGLIRDDICNSVLKGNEDGIEITLDEFFKLWVTQPLTMVFRLSSFSFEWSPKYKFYRDSYEIYHLLKTGKGYLFSFCGGVHINHSGGIVSGESESRQRRMSLLIAKDLYENNKDCWTKQNYESNLQWELYQKHIPLRERLSLSLELFKLNGQFKTLVKNIIR